MITCAYALQALAWTAFGAVLGVVLDRVVIDLRRIAQATTMEAPVEPRKTKGWLSAAVAPTLIVCALVSVVIGLVNSRTNTAQDAEMLRDQQCQLAYANGFADAIDARSDATTAAQLALDDLMTEIGALAASPSVDNSARFQAALSEYLSKRAEARKQQQENPYPPAPRDLCK